MAEERLVLIDTDAGIDDAMAIIMCLKAHKRQDISFRIVGITCVSGNTGIDNVTRNVTRTLQLMDEQEIPIFRGASGPMVLDCDVKIKFHGLDGFGDANLPEIQPKVESEHAVNAIIRLAHQYQDKLTVLALGPLTNLAYAVRLCPNLPVKDVYLMGGNMQGAGNDTICAEFNFYFDPEAVHILLTAYTCPIFIVPLEVGRDKVMQTFEWRVTELGTQLNTVESQFLNFIESYNLEHRHKVGEKWICYDATASVALIAPNSIKNLINHHCVVELHGKYSRGQLIVDFRPHLQPAGNIFIVEDMDADIYKKMMKWAFGGPYPL